MKAKKALKVVSAGPADTALGLLLAPVGLPVWVIRALNVFFLVH